MEMHQIRYFLAVAETLNFTRAADACHVAQPSLSRAVGKLEEELGGALFRRERGHTHLTDLGRAMLPLLRQSYEAALAAKTQADSYHGGDYAPLRLGLSLTVGGGLIAAAIAELAAAYPGLRVEARRGTAGEILAALRAGEIEIAIAARTDTAWERFDGWPLFEEGFLLVTPPGHPLAGRDGVTFADLVGERLMARPYCENIDQSNSARTQAAELAGRAVEAGHAIASDTDALVFAGHGVGASLLPASHGRSDGVGTATVSTAELTRTVMLYGVAGRQRSAALGSLIALLRAADWSAYAV